RRRHTRSLRDWSSDVCSSDLYSSRQRQLLLRFPDELLVDYGITPFFKPKHASAPDKKMIALEELTLPTTVNPAQVPKIVSVGIRSEERRVGKACRYREFTLPT